MGPKLLNKIFFKINHVRGCFVYYPKLLIGYTFSRVILHTNFGMFGLQNRIYITRNFEKKLNYKIWHIIIVLLKHMKITNLKKKIVISV